MTRRSGRVDAGSNDISQMNGRSLTWGAAAGKSINQWRIGFPQDSGRTFHSLTL